MAEPDSRQRFWSELTAGLANGVPVGNCLRDLAAELGEQPFGEVVSELAAAVAGGTTLSAAMRERPDWFGGGAIKLVEGGEAMGILHRTVALVAEHAADCPACVAWRGTG